MKYIVRSVLSSCGMLAALLCIRYLYKEPLDKRIYITAGLIAIGEIVSGVAEFIYSEIKNKPL